MVITKNIIIMILASSLVACGIHNSKLNTTKIMNAAIQDLEPGKAMLHIYRPPTFLRGGVTAKVYFGKNTLVKVRNGEYQALAVRPGEYFFRFSKNTRKKGYLRVNIKSGQHMYLKIAPEYHNSFFVGSNYYMISSFVIGRMPKARAELEISGLKASLSYTVPEAINNKPISGVFMGCNKPYKLTQDCSFFSGPKRKVEIDGLNFKITGSANGDIIFMAGKWFRSDLAAMAFKVAKDLLLKNKINIKKVRPVITLGQTQGYLLILDGNGYDVLSKYTLK